MAGSEARDRDPPAAYRARGVRRRGATCSSAIWGFADIELLPLRFLVVVAARSAATCSAPTTARRMVGFCFAIPGLKPGGQPYLHSHMLGVLPEYRNAGIGRRLKLRQREEALARGIDLIEWTFDPLELKNAFFNIERLGAIVRRYVREPVRHHHQPAARRPAHRPLHRRMVDRFAARARPSLAGAAVPAQRRRGAHRVPGRHRRASAREDPTRAREIQKAIARAVSGALRRGLAVTGFERSRSSRHLPAGATGNENRTHHPAADPHAAGAFLRDQLRPHHRARHHPGGSRRRTAPPAGAKSPPARTRSTTRSGPPRPG